MRRIVVVTIALAISLAGYANAQTGVKKFGQTTGPLADEARAELMQLEKDKAVAFQKALSSPTPNGKSVMADFFDKGENDDVFIINGDGTLVTKADHLAMWRTGAMTQQSDTPSDYRIYVYDDGNLAVMTWVSTIHLTSGGKQKVHVSRIWNTYLKQDGKWIIVVHGVSRKGA